MVRATARPPALNGRVATAESTFNTRSGGTSKHRDLAEPPSSGARSNHDGVHLYPVSLQANIRKEVSRRKGRSLRRFERLSCRLQEKMALLSTPQRLLTALTLWTWGINHPPVCAPGSAAHRDRAQGRNRYVSGACSWNEKGKMASDNANRRDLVRDLGR